MGPPSSGGVAVLQILGLLEHFDMAGLGPTADGFQALLEASKLAFADRNLYLADSDFVRVPLPGLLDQGYLTARAQQIRLDASMEKAAAGNPPWRDGRAAGARTRARSCPAPAISSSSTPRATPLSMTTTIESGFGSRLMVGGFLLNNELTDFSFLPQENGRAGRQPRRGRQAAAQLDGADDRVRPRRRPELLVGSPGGSQIIGYVAQALVGVLDWGLSPQQAVAAGHVLSRNGPAELEAGTDAAALEAALAARGQKVQVKALNSGLHAIALVNGRLQSGVDPRREGSAQGE